MGASGHFVTYFVIVSCTNMAQMLMRGCQPETVGRAHPSGWVQSNHFTEWFAHVIQEMKPSDTSPVLLILDGHYSHARNVVVIDIARRNHVTVLSLLLLSTPNLQQLNKTFIGKFEVNYSE